MILVSSLGVIVTLLCSQGRVTATGTPHSKVQALTDKNFDQAVLGDPANGLWLLKFYAPWCGHCKKMAPTLEKVAPYMAGKMAIGKIDCTKEKATCKRFEVRGYPTLKFFRDGEFFDYPAGRDADSIIEFGEKMSQNAVAVVTSFEDALENVAANNRDGVAFIAYDPKTDGDDVEAMIQSTTLTQVFGQVARKQQASGHFGLIGPGVAASEVANFGVVPSGEEELGPFIIKLEKDVEPKVFKGEMTSADFLDFVKENSLALVTAIGAHNFRAVGRMGKPLMLGVVNPTDEAKTDALIAELKQYAKSGPTSTTERYTFGWIDGKKWERFMSQFNVTTESLPELVMIDVQKRTFWQNKTVPSVNDFVEKILSGDIVEREQESPDRNAGLMRRFEIFFLQYLPWTLIGLVLGVGGIFFLLLPSGPDEVEMPPAREKRAAGKAAAKEAAAENEGDETKKEK